MLDRFTRRFVMTNLLTLLLLLSVLPPAFARPVPMPPVQTSVSRVVTITADRLNVRNSPDADSAVVAKLLLDDQVYVNAQDESGTWYQVILSDGTEGWIAAAYAESVSGVVAVTGELVPFDAAASLEQEQAATTPITLQPTRVASQPVVTDVPVAITAEITETESVEIETVAEDIVEAITEEIAEQVVEEVVAEVAEVTVPTAYTTPPAMNVRRGPGTNYPVATSVPAGTALLITALNAAGDWYQVTLDGDSEPAWIYAPLTTAAGPLATVPTLTDEELPSPPEPEPVVAAPAPAAPAPVPAAVAPPAGAGFFGYGIQINAWQGDKNGSAGMVNDIGFNWAKQQVRWEFVENEPGAVNWSEMDQIIDALHGRGINVLFSVVTAPQWTRPDKPGTGGPPNDFNLYANFVGAMAGRYCGRLQAIEVWNEQNLQREWEGFPLDPALYMDLLRRAHGSIKAACPSIIVVSGATTPTGNSGVAVDDIDYLRGMYNNGLAAYSDAIGVHPSGYGQPPRATFQQWQAGQYDGPSHVNHRSFYFYSTMVESRQVMVQYGDTNKRLWPTEFGWASSQSPHPGYEYAAYNSAQQQAQYTVEAYNMMRDWGWVGVPFLWNLNYTHGEMGQWSIMGKPVYDALKNMPK